jgi:hypothetical protein
LPETHIVAVTAINEFNKDYRRAGKITESSYEWLFLIRMSGHGYPKKLSLQLVTGVINSTELVTVKVILLNAFKVIHG